MEADYVELHMTGQLDSWSGRDVEPIYSQEQKLVTPSRRALPDRSFAKGTRQCGLDRSKEILGMHFSYFWNAELTRFFLGYAWLDILNAHLFLRL